MTGGSKGIGRAVVLRFARAGYRGGHLRPLGRRSGYAHSRSGREVPGAVLHTLPADLSQPEDCARFAAFVLELGGRSKCW